MTTRLSRAPLRSSVIVLVLISMVFTAAALTLFVEKAGNDLLVEVRQADAKRLRIEAFSALEVTLAVLEDFRQADNGLHSTAEGWGDPLGWAGYTPSEGRKIDITFQDESGKIPLGHADLPTLTNLFENWQMAPIDAGKLADAIVGWMQAGYLYSTALAPDYAQAQIPYAEPERALRTFSELAAIDVAKDVFFDENGTPNADYWRFVNDCSVFTFSQPDINGTNPDVMAAVGQFTDAQQQQIGGYLNGVGQFAQQGQQWFQNTSTVVAVAGLGGNANPFATTVSALRILVTVHDGQSQYRLSAVVAPQGGAGLNQTNAVNPANAASGSSASATASVASTAQPAQTASSATTAATASQSINYPFTILELLEEDEIPQTPPPPKEPQT
jgi:Type II secretion system (T2SS), protein K